MLHVRSGVARGHQTVSSKKPEGFRELCREGILIKQPTTGDYEKFEITQHGALVARELGPLA